MLTTELSSARWRTGSPDLAGAPGCPGAFAGPPPAQVARHRVPRGLGRGELRDIGGRRRSRPGVLVLVEAGVLPRERRAGPVLPLPGGDGRGQGGGADGELSP